LLHAGLEAAALDHEAVDHAVKKRVAVEPAVHIGEKICHRGRRFFGIKLQSNRSQVRVQLDHCRLLSGGSEGSRRALCMVISSAATPSMKRRPRQDRGIAHACKERVAPSLWPNAHYPAPMLTSRRSPARDCAPN